MGIQGLLPFLAASTEEIHISIFENQYVAVDAYCWLHKGIYSCSLDLAMKRPTTKYVTYCMRYIEMLQHFNVKPILVFDGRILSSKQETEKKRREERNRKYKKGLDLIRAGRTHEGNQLLGESVDVGHELVVNLVRQCRQSKIDCIVAPFEADSQLSFFSLNKVVACVISEDSDLLVYGCDRVVFKMDKSGRGKLIEKKNLYLSLGMEEDEFTSEKFRNMCILSGCDYLPSLPSIGPANALKFVKLINDRDIIEVLPKLPIYLNKPKINVTPDYVLGFKIAIKTFKHQLVYDPFQRKQVPLTPVQSEDEIIGEKLPESQAFQLAIGNIDPITMKVLDHYNPDKGPKTFTLIWKVPTATREQSPHSSQPQNGKRPSEVKLFKMETKRYCVSSIDPLENNLSRKSSDSVTPQSCFDFVLPQQTGKKIASSEDKDCVKSRYFGNLKKTCKKERSPGKKKGESHEEYLRRTFEEVLAESDDESDHENRSNCAETENVPDENFEGKRIFVLDLIDAESKNKTEESPENNLKATASISSPRTDFFPHIKLSEEETRHKSPASEKVQLVEFLKQMGSLQSSVADNKNDNCEESTDDSLPDLLDIIERDKSEEKNDTIESTRVTSSPVFKVTNIRNTLNANFTAEENIDTTSSSKSLYFSPSINIREVMGTHRNSPSSSMNSSSSKKKLKKPPVSRTLFQFGFKKD